MKFGVLGTGMVGRAIANKLVSRGHHVMMGARARSNIPATEWAATAGNTARAGSFSEAASFGDILFNCVHGAHTLEALEAAGHDALRGKILIDIANPMDYSQGDPPLLLYCNDDSLGERIQRAFPEVRVVKTLNTVGFPSMVDGTRIPGEHDMFVCGNDVAAKAEVSLLLREEFRWSNVIDLGDISSARATEMLMPLFLRLWKTLGTFDFNIQVVVKPKA